MVVSVLGDPCILTTICVLQTSSILYKYHTHTHSSSTRRHVLVIFHTFSATCKDSKCVLVVVISFFLCKVDRSNRWRSYLYVLRAASHYTILSLRRPAMTPHDAVADRTSCSVRASAILSAAILTIGGYRRPS